MWPYLLGASSSPPHPFSSCFPIGHHMASSVFPEYQTEDVLGTQPVLGYTEESDL